MQSNFMQVNFPTANSIRPAASCYPPPFLQHFPEPSCVIYVSWWKVNKICSDCECQRTERTRTYTCLHTHTYICTTCIYVLLMIFERLLSAAESFTWQSGNCGICCKCGDEVATAEAAWLHT